jgi:hypothetical protein
MLTETEIKAAKARQKSYKLSDDRGLHLLITPAGSRLWRFRYSHAGRESMVALGSYPHVSLKRAREERDRLRQVLVDRIDPAAMKRADRAVQADTFKAIAEEWLSRQRFEPATLEKARWTFDTLINPYVGSTPVKALTAPAILEVLRKLEATGKHETAHRARQRISQVFRYAIATGRAESDPTRDLRGALTRRGDQPAGHHRARQGRRAAAGNRRLPGRSCDLRRFEARAACVRAAR